MLRVSCIIPAYNEEKTISSLIDCVKNSDVFGEIIVVSDGSIDSTNQILENRNDIVFIALEKNQGKGCAVWHGLQHATGELVIMLDADLIGIDRGHFEKLLDPILNREADVVIGIISHKKRAWMSFSQFVTQNLSGQQAFWRHLAKDADIKNTRFGVEIALKNHFKNKGAKTKKVMLKGVSHLMKEQKMGIEEGLKHRGKMYKEVGKEIGNNLKRKLKELDL